VNFSSGFPLESVPVLYLALALGIWVAQDDGPAGTITLNDGAKATRFTSIRVDLKLTSPGAGDVHMSISVEGQPRGRGCRSGKSPSTIFRRATVRRRSRCG